MIALLLSVMLLMPSLVGATTYYVSQTATNGYVVGNDANAGTAKGTAKLTLAAVKALPYAEGDTIYVNDGTYTDTQLGSTGYFDIAAGKAVTLLPETDYGTTLAGHTQALLLRIRNDSTSPVTIGKFILDCEKTTTAPGTYIATGIQSDTTTVQTSVTLAGTRIQNCSTQLYSDNAKLGTVTFTGVIFAGLMKDGVTGSTSLADTGAKTYVINGLTLSSVTSTDTATATVFTATRLSTSTNPLSLYVNAVTGTITAPGALGASAVVSILALHGITNAVNPAGVSQPVIVENLNVTLTASSTTTSCYGVQIDNSAAGANAVGNTPVVRNSIINMNCPAGYAIAIGDSTTAYDVTDALVYGNTLTNTFYNGVATPHGISLGRVTRGIVRSNYVRGFAVGVLTAINQGGIVTGNLIEGAYYAPLFAKGNGATTIPTIANNTVIMDDAIVGAKFGNYGCLGVAVQGATNNTDTLFKNNNCYVRSGTGWKYAVTDTSQVAHFDHNNDFSLVTLTTPWSYQGTTYATATLWNAAATVGDDTNVDPVFVDPANDYRLAPTSTLRGAGLNWDTLSKCADVRGRRCFIPFDVGGYQTSGGDPAATRTARQ